MFYSYFIENDGDYFIPNNCEGDLVLFITNENKTRYVSIFSDGGIIGDNIWEENSERESVGIQKLFKDLYDKANEIFNSEYFDMLSGEIYQFTDKQTEMFINEISKIIFIERYADKIKNYKPLKQYPYQNLKDDIIAGESEFKHSGNRNYYVSEMGRVRYGKPNGPLIPQHKDKDGDLVLCKEEFLKLNNDYESNIQFDQTYKIYWLVADTWLKTEKENAYKQYEDLFKHTKGRLEIHHINNDACDNSVNNLLYLHSDIHHKIHNRVNSN